MGWREGKAPGLGNGLRDWAGVRASGAAVAVAVAAAEAMAAAI